MRAIDQEDQNSSVLGETGALRLASRIRKQRHDRGWKQRELSQRSGIAPDRLSRLERGSEIRVHELVALARAFGAGVDDLLGTAGRKEDDLEVAVRNLRAAAPPEALPVLAQIFRAMARGFQAGAAASEEPR